MNIKPCPFCGDTPHFPQAGEVFGTCYDVSCCSFVEISFQISDADSAREFVYNDEIQSYDDDTINKVRTKLIALWNARGKEEYNKALNLLYGTNA